MAKNPTFPDCFDNVDQVSIGSLKKWGYLKPFNWTSGTITWTRGGRTVGAIAITVDMFGEYAELEYMRGGKHIKYRIQLESSKSNLGRGRVWYFICPVAGRRCRKLYLIGDKFLSRYAFPNAVYSKQIESGRMREWRAALEVLQVVEKKREFLSARYARPFYKGQPTRRFRSILDHEEKALAKFWYLTHFSKSADLEYC